MELQQYTEPDTLEPEQFLQHATPLFLEPNLARTIPLLFGPPGYVIYVWLPKRHGWTMFSLGLTITASDACHSSPDLQSHWPLHLTSHENA